MGFHNAHTQSTSKGLEHLESSRQPGCIIHSSHSQLLPRRPSCYINLLCIHHLCPPCSRFFGLIAVCVCIDTTPQSHTAVWGQRSPAEGQLNDKVNEGGRDPVMPLWPITERREEERKWEENRGLERSKGVGREAKSETLEDEWWERGAQDGEEVKCQGRKDKGEESEEWEVKVKKNWKKEGEKSSGEQIRG